MNTIAVVLEQPERIALSRLALDAPTADDVVVDVDWSGISTGTERLLWSGRMPPFPRHGLSAGAGLRIGRASRRGRSATGLHVGAAGLRSRRAMLRRSARAASAAPRRAWSCRPRASCRSTENLGERGSAAGAGGDRLPRAVGARRLQRRTDRRPRRARPPARAARRSRSATSRPSCGRTIRARVGGAVGYGVIDPDADTRRDYRAIYDVSGDAGASRYADRRALRRAARSCSPASTASRWPSRFRRPSCARRASASPPNGSRRISPRSARWSNPAGCRSTA